MSSSGLRESTHTRLSAGIASPLGVCITLPLLVISIAGIISGAAAYSYQNGVATLSGNAFAAKLSLVAGELEKNTEGAEPLLEFWASWLQQHASQPEHLPALSSQMKAMLAERPGVAWLSWSDANGRFIGMHQLPSGEFELVEHTGPNGTPQLRRRYALDNAGAPSLVEEQPDDYDPHQRPFWTQATGSTQITWSEPYTFTEGVVGITASLALRQPNGAVIGVATVDFSLDSLSDMIGHLSSLSGDTLLVVSESGTVLAWAKPDGSQITHRSLPHVSELQDPVIAAFMDSCTASDKPKDQSVHQLDVPDHGIYLSQAQPTHLAGSQTWYVGGYAPLELFSGPAYQFRIQAGIIGGIALVIAIGVSLYVARAINRHRIALTSARTKASAAEAEARELGSYQLIEKLGAGGMGEVWLGSHRTLARPAAIKIINPTTLGRLNAAETTTAFERFQREAKVTATLRGRNTVEIYDFGMADDLSFFLVMELLDGFDLQELIEETGPLPIGRVIHLIRQACLSLGEAHRRGLVHRDIKPGNIFCCQLPGEGDVVKVLDFGLVLEADQSDNRLTQDGSVSGTPAYMAPEQALGNDLDHRADIYALACVAYVLATGQTVFDHHKSMEQMIAHAREAPVAPSKKLGKPLPPAFDDIIMHCLAKDPAERPNSVEILSKALAAIDLPADQRWTESHIQGWWRERECRCPEADAQKCAEEAGQALRRKRSDIDPKDITETSSAMSVAVIQPQDQRAAV